MKKITILICLISMLQLIASQLNYQNRVVYYNESVNVCSYNPHSDMIRLNINL